MFVRAKEDSTVLRVLGEHKAVKDRGIEVGSRGLVKRIRFLGQAKDN